MRNWGYKLTALLLALGLWATLMSQDTSLTREKVFTNVSATVSGAETLKRNGLIVTSLEDTGSFTVKTNTPQGVYSTTTASNYNLRLDLSKITQAGTQQVKVSTSNASTYGTVSEVSPEYVTVEVEEYVTRYRIPVSLYTVGDPPDGFYASAASAEPSTITVSGPASLVNQIVRAEIAVNQADLPARAGSVRSALAFYLVDENGTIISSDLIEVTNNSVLLDTVIVDQTLYYMRKVSLSDIGILSGTPADGYAVRSVVMEPSTVTIAALSEEVLEDVSAVFANSSVSVKNASQSINTSVSLRKPSEIAYVIPERVTVAVEIAPVITSRLLEGVKVSLAGTGNGKTASLSTKTLDVLITGEQLWVKSLRSAQVKLQVDVSELEAGSHEVAPTITITDSDGISYEVSTDPVTVEVTVKQK